MRIALSRQVARISSATTIDFSLFGVNKLPKVVPPIRSSLQSASQFNNCDFAAQMEIYRNIESSVPYVGTTPAFLPLQP